MFSGPCFSGSDSWTLDECHTYFRAALEHSKDLPCVVAHETHRGRCLFSPWQTQRLVQEFPDLKLTADVSHWTVVAERLLRSPEELQVIKTVVPAVRHIHGRVGGPQVCGFRKVLRGVAAHAVRPARACVQSPQVEAGVPKRSDELTSERSYFESVWSMIWEAQRAAGVQLSTFTPGYDSRLAVSPHLGTIVAIVVSVAYAQSMALLDLDTLSCRIRRLWTV